jgi:anti-anti-sigma factor
MGLATLVRDEEAGAARLVVAGEIDLNNVGEFRAALQELVGGSSRAVLDLTEVTHFGSSAIGALVGANKVAEARRTQMVIRPSRIVRRVLEVTMLDETFALGDPAPGPPTTPG